ncbi:MAG TPA: hypothetical protein DCG57_14975 [Candidatus Riflebacteria bacterium]|nr:hypothetical protein [Candidatus Riflebacteria bacterium]
MGQMPSRLGYQPTDHPTGGAVNSSGRAYVTTPRTASQIVEGSGMHLNEVAKYIGMLMRSELISATHHNKDFYWSAKIKSNGKSCHAP